MPATHNDGSVTPTSPPPLVSIGLPVFNGARFLSQAIDSILAQSFTDFELVISDNGSTDETPDICQRYTAADPRVRYFRLNQNMGAAFNYNRVFGLSRGTYFRWAAHDDIISPHFLQVCLDVLGSHIQIADSPAIVYPRSAWIDENGNVIHLDRCPMHITASSALRRGLHAVNHMSNGNPIFGLIPRETLRKTRLIDSFITSDYVLIFELALSGDIVRVDEVLFHRRFHSGMSRQANVKKDDVLAWFDPNAKQWLSDWQKVFLEYQRSTWRAQHISLLGRLILSLSLFLVIPFRRLRVLQGYYRRRLIKALCSE